MARENHSETRESAYPDRAGRDCPQGDGRRSHIEALDAFRVPQCPLGYQPFQNSGGHKLYPSFGGPMAKALPYRHWFSLPRWLKGRSPSSSNAPKAAVGPFFSPATSTVKRAPGRSRIWRTAPLRDEKPPYWTLQRKRGLIFSFAPANASMQGGCRGLPYRRARLAPGRSARCQANRGNCCPKSCGLAGGSSLAMHFHLAFQIVKSLKRSRAVSLGTLKLWKATSPSWLRRQGAIRLRHIGYAERYEYELAMAQVRKFKGDRPSARCCHRRCKNTQAV